MGTTPKNQATDPLQAAIGRLVSQPQEEPRIAQPIAAPFDVKQTPRETTILIDLPGVDEDEIDVSFRDGSLRIIAAREFNHDLEDAEEYTTLGRTYGTFACVVTLPESADVEAMTAKYKRGVLKVQVPNSPPC